MQAICWRSRLWEDDGSGHLFYPHSHFTVFMDGPTFTGTCNSSKIHTRSMY